MLYGWVRTARTRRFTRQHALQPRAGALGVGVENRRRRAPSIPALWTSPLPTLLTTIAPGTPACALQFCDRGTLYGAMKAGHFHRAMPNGAIGVDLAAIVAVLLDVAYAVQYLHALHLMHGDIKVRASTRTWGAGVAHQNTHEA